MNGMELAERYYETYGRPMLHEKYPEYETRIAVGLVGEGSECFGFDDRISRDHDFGPVCGLKRKIIRRSEAACRRITRSFRP